MKRLTFLSVAETELTEAAQFYEECEAGVGKHFLDAVGQVAAKIRQHPERWAYYEKPIRSFKVGPFPYRLLYRELSDKIQIVAVMHLSRRPGYWKQRLR